MICKTQGTDYENSKPNYYVIKLINSLYEDGNVIKIFTGRGSRSGKDWHTLTESQLKSWGLNYTDLIMGKPHADYFIDDKNIPLTAFNCIDPSIVKAIVKAYQFEKKILVVGNGGLAAEAEHFAAEMVGKFAFDVYLPCLPLTSNSSLFSALGNDLGFEYVFAHEVAILGQRGDVFIGMTTSQSKNIVKAEEVARNSGLTTVMICGQKSDVKGDYILRMDGEDVAQIQNNAIQYLHALAYSVKKEMLGAKPC